MVEVRNQTTQSAWVSGNRLNYRRKDFKWAGVILRFIFEITVAPAHAFCYMESMQRTKDNFHHPGNPNRITLRFKTYALHAGVVILLRCNDEPNS